ncbi:MAG: DNA-binding protein [Syntrophobacteraceae bacterium]
MKQTGTDKVRHRFIKGYLALSGITFAQIGREAGVTRQMVGAVVQGQKRSAKVEELLLKYGVPEALLKKVV